MQTVMGAERTDRSPETLRQHLRGATAAAHDRLDQAMRPPEDWRSNGAYARFLSSQFQARIAVEEWLSDHAPADLTPPEQTSALADDLRALGAEMPTQRFEFSLEDQGSATMLGAAWVLAGSSLGNRAMHRDMRRALPEVEQWPDAFLSSTEMTKFWHGLRSRIEAPASPEEQDTAVRAAMQVFDHFLHVAQSTQAQSTQAQSTGAQSTGAQSTRPQSGAEIPQ